MSHRFLRCCRLALMGIPWFLAGCLGDGAPDNVTRPDFEVDGSAVAFAPDGSLVLRRGDDWDFVSLPDLRRLRTLEGAGKFPDAACFSLEEQFLATALDDTVRVWRLSDGKRVAQCKAPHKYPPRLTKMALSPDGQWVAASGLIDQTLFVWRVADGKLLAQRDDDAYRVLGWRRDGVLKAGRGFRIQHDHLVEVPGEETDFSGIQHYDLWPSADSEQLAITGAGLSLQSLRGPGGAGVTARRWSQPLSGLTNVAWAPDQTRLALRLQTGDSVNGPHIRSFVQVRRIPDGALLRAMQVGTSKDGSDTLGTDMHITGDGQWLVLKTRGGKLKIWDMSQWKTPIPEAEAGAKP